MIARISRRWRSVSFRAGLWSALSVGVVAVLSIIAFLFLVFTLFVVTDGIAQVATIDRAADQLALGVEPADLNVDIFDDFAPGNRRATADTAFWVVLEDGAVVGQGGGVALDTMSEIIHADFSDPDFGIDPETGEGLADISGLKDVDGKEWFLVERTIDTTAGRTFRIVSATDGIFSLGGFAQQSFPVTIPVVLTLMAVAMAVTSYLTRRALRRVERMRAEVELITQESLDRRVPRVDADDDIDKLAVTMNDMLERLERSNQQQSQFLADASHELRSPVSGLLAQLDVASAYPDRVDTDELLPKLHGEAERLQLLVNDLLFLSRSEAGESSVQSPTEVDIDALLERELEHQRLLHDEVTIAIIARCEGAVAGDQRDLERAVRNLVDNAIRHASTSVELSASIQDGQIVVAVVDDGPGIPEDQHERIFERFVRLDEARARDSGGSGLGLAIAHGIASSHNGSIQLRPSDSGAHFELRLPVS